MIKLSSSDPHDGTLRDLAPDLTPMLDILFILLVFFMLTAGAVFQSLDVRLPANVSDDLPVLQAPKHIMLEIRPDYYVINDRRIADLDTLKAEIPALLAQKPEHELIIAGDKDVPIEQLLNVLTYLQAQGVEAANILMQSEDNK